MFCKLEGMYCRTFSRHVANEDEDEDMKKEMKMKMKI
jgi:hypothetical protein